MPNIYYSYMQMVRPYIRNGMVTSYRGLLLKFISTIKLHQRQVPKALVFMNSILFKKIKEKSKEEIEEILNKDQVINSNMIIDLVVCQLCDLVKYFAFQNHYLDFIEFNIDQQRYTFDIVFGFNSEVEREYLKQQKELAQDETPEELSDELEDIEGYEGIEDVETEEDLQTFSKENKEENKKELGDVKDKSPDIPDLVLLKIKDIYIRFINDVMYERARKFIRKNIIVHQVIINNLEDWNNYNVRFVSGSTPRYFLTQSFSLKFKMKGSAKDD